MLLPSPLCPGKGLGNALVIPPVLEFEPLSFETYETQGSLALVPTSPLEMTPLEPLSWDPPGAGLSNISVNENLVQETTPKAPRQKLRLIPLNKESDSPRLADKESETQGAATLEKDQTTVLRENQYATQDHKTTQDQFQNEGEMEVSPNYQDEPPSWRSYPDPRASSFGAPRLRADVEGE